METERKPRPRERKQLVSVSVSPRTVEQIDALADRRGISRAELVRQAISEFVADRYESATTASE